LPPRIPEGTASNIEELELLWPMLFLYRRAMKAAGDDPLHDISMS
jgi:N-methylhydantoinase B